MLFNPLISVIIPIYNVERHLEKCLNSIVNQTYKNLEIILINDGSTDNSGVICEKYAENDSHHADQQGSGRIIKRMPYGILFCLWTYG